MTQIFAAALISFIVTALLAVPFINLLYRLKFQRQREVHVLSPIFTKLHAWKVGTPNSGGVLIILVTLGLSYFFIQPVLSEISPTIIIFLAFLLYGILGLYDDVKKYFGYQKEKFWGMRLRYKLILQIGFALLLGWLIFEELQVGGVVALSVPLLGEFLVDPSFYVPFAALTIIAAANAFNITDGLDGLSSGLLAMTLTAFLVVSVWVSSNFILEGVSLSQLELQLILSIWLGATLAFLYYNIHPARMWMGDSGALAFGAAMAVVALLLGIPFLLIIIGGVYVIETASSLLQWYSMRFMDRKLFLIAPIHHHFEAQGWPETKVTMRFWVAGAFFSLAGLFWYFYLLGL